MGSTGSSGNAPAVMKAWQYKRCGGGASSLELNEVPVPKPGKGEVLVKVRAASVNPADYHLQSGRLRPFLPARLPFTPGMDLAGDVVELGPGVTTLAKGDAVFGCADVMKGGGFGQYALLPLKTTAVRPPTVEPAQAACLGVAGGTALISVRDYTTLPLPRGPDSTESAKSAELPPPMNVMVAGASGGIGHYAVQLAKLAGAHVTATCGARNLQLVKSLGADEALDYKSAEGKALKSPSGRKYNFMLDCTLPNSGHSWKNVSPALSPSGKWVQVSPSFCDFVNVLINYVSPSKQRTDFVLALPKASDMETLARYSAKGLLRANIEARIPFDRAPEALERCKEGHISGKVVVVMDD